jgi:hypothetical protein
MGIFLIWGRERWVDDVGLEIFVGTITQILPVKNEKDILMNPQKYFGMRI